MSSCSTRSSLILLVFLSACASVPSPQASSELDAPVEAVVRNVMTKPIFASAVEIPICFDKPEIDVTGNVVRRLRESDRRVRRCAAADIRFTVNSGVVQVHVRSFSKPAIDTYVIHAGYWCGVLCADDTEFTVEKRGAEWVITRSVFQWIS
jgi:hypothetical protein